MKGEMMKAFMQTLAVALVGILGMAGAAQAAEALNVYGPGGPAPAMKEAAAAFEKKTGTRVTVTAGPTPKWINKAKADADVV